MHIKDSPFHSIRHDLVEQLKNIVQTGDIAYCQGAAYGPCNLPFSALVCWLTDSKYAHAALILVEEIKDRKELYLIEVGESDTRKLRMIDWLDECAKPYLTITRLKNITKEQVSLLEGEIYNILDADNDYDYHFNDPKLYYCTESVVETYRKVLGVQITEGDYVKNLVKRWVYPIVVAVNWFYKIFTKASLPLDQKIYIAGDSIKGMVASKETKIVFKYEK